MAPRRMCLLFLSLLLAGCAAPGSSETPTDAAAFPPTEEVERLHLPFDAYSMSLAGLYTIAYAEDLLTAECMAARGHDWDVIDRPTDLADLRNRRRYGVVEMPVAEQFGYHVPPGLLTPVEVERQYDRRESSLSEGQQEAAFGADGCAREASARLRPDNEADPDLLGQLGRTSLRDSLRQPAVAAALRGWRECVRQAGFDYQDPLAAMSDPTWWADESAGASGQEIAVAVADVRCKEQTGLVGLWHAAEARLQEEAIRRHSAQFQELAAAMAEELAAAREILARPR